MPRQPSYCMNELIEQMYGRLSGLQEEVEDLNNQAARKSGPARELGLEEVSDFLYTLAVQGRALEEAIISYRGLLGNRPHMPF